MVNPNSVLEELLCALPAVRPQMYFKTSLTALSHAMEDQVLAGSDQPLMIASFQQERFYRQESHRYMRLADITNQVYVLSAAGTGFDNHSDKCETIAFEEEDALRNEWHLVVLGKEYSACLICREHQPAAQVSLRWRWLPSKGTPGQAPPVLDQTRRFEGIWTLDRHICELAADLLLQRIEAYRPELKSKILTARSEFLPNPGILSTEPVESDPFTQRLVTYVQASQYKLLKAYKTMSAQEQRERSINSITAAIRQSLNPAEIFAIATQELGQVLSVCRCVIYRYAEGDQSTEINHEFRQDSVDALQGHTWPLVDNPLFQQVVKAQETLTVEDVRAFPEIDALLPLLERWQIHACLLVPLIHQQRLLGMIELHQCQPESKAWADHDIKLVESIATQLSVALIQAEAYAHLQDLNQQLEALERTRSNLIAITGHELRTPLSTIRVCLESMVTEPDMPKELQQVMLESAMEDSERMQKLVQDFLTLSRLESGRIEWNLESLSLQECVDLALSCVRARDNRSASSVIQTDIPDDLPFIRADGEWVVEVLTKLIDNACKFTDPGGAVTIEARRQGAKRIEVSVIDSGRGIEPERLEKVFERFYQEEGALRRSVGGTGLGLAICRQIIEAMGGKIWATSDGKDQGTQIHFTLPVAAPKRKAKPRKRKSKKVSV